MQGRKKREVTTLYLQKSTESSCRTREAHKTPPQPSRPSTLPCQRQPHTYLDSLIEPAQLIHQSLWKWERETSTISTASQSHETFDPHSTSVSDCFCTNSMSWAVVVQPCNSTASTVRCLCYANNHSTTYKRAPVYTWFMGILLPLLLLLLLLSGLFYNHRLDFWDRLQ